jgi:hypothetical protein
MRMRLRVLSGFGVVVLAAICAATAWSWSQSYITNYRFWPGATAGSAWNGSLIQNYIRWDNRYGGYPSVGLRYCRTDGSCYSYVWKQVPGVFYDTRTISYGQGQCHAYAGNNYDVYVYECRVSNG